jgi:hypothetical protein
MRLAGNESSATNDDADAACRSVAGDGQPAGGEGAGAPGPVSQGIVTWIERTYHRRRRQDTLGRLTPIEYETIVPTLAAQAA